MPEISLKNLLFEEYKTAFEHMHYLEAKRDRYVLGSITASGAILALITKMFSDEHFLFQKASIEFIAVIFLLCMALGFLSYVLRKAYESFSPVMKHYENAVAVARYIIYGDEKERLVKINCEAKPLIQWLDTRKNESIANRDTKISDLSKNVLLISYIIWFTFAAVAAVRLIIMLSL